MNKIKEVFKHRRKTMMTAAIIFVVAVLLLIVSLVMMNKLNAAYDSSISIKDGSKPWINGQYFVPNTLRDSYICDLLMNFGIAFLAVSILVVILCFLIPPHEKINTQNDAEN